MIEARARARGAFFKVGGEHPGAADAEEIVHVLVAALGFGRALRDKGNGSHAAGPAFLNRASTVKIGVPSVAVAAPKVT